MSAELTEARAAGIEAAADHVSAYLDASANGMEAAGVPNARRYLEPLEHVFEDLRKLAAKTRGDSQPRKVHGAGGGSKVTPLFTDADKDLLRALPSETRKAVVNMLARHRKGGMADAARAVRAVGDDAQHGTVRGIFRGVADVLQRNAETPLVLEPLPAPPTIDPTTLEDAEILDLPPLDRAKVLADLASQGLLLAPMLVDVGVPCPLCDGGKITMVIDGVQQQVDHDRCDGLGVIDGRRRCADPECLSHGEPLVYSLGGGWECSRKHGHAEREATRFVVPTDLAAVVKPGPVVADPEAFPWDVEGVS